MNERALLSAAAGICFGLWPLVMNRVRIDPFATVIIFLAGSLLFALPAAFFGQWSNITGSQLKIAAVACAISAVGTICFNRMLATTTVAEVANMFLLMLVVQVAIPAALLLRNGATTRQVAGLAAAGVAIVLLGKR
ncbi:MAG: EamA family transporter [Acidobacteriota bacterium]